MGETREKRENYDLLEIRMLYLPDAAGTEGSGILRMLDRLLSPRTSVEDKLDSLEKDFGVRVTTSDERTVRRMCDYSSVVRNDGIREGRKAGMREGRKEGEEKLAALINLLLKEGRGGEISLVTTDAAVRNDYYRKYGLS